jgi:hypothetical protein
MLSEHDKIVLSTVRGDLGSQIAFVAVPSDRSASHYNISVVQQGIYGHRPLDLLYGGTEADMMAKALELNSLLGIDSNEAVKRVASSMVGVKKKARK